MGQSEQHQPRWRTIAHDAAEMAALAAACMAAVRLGQLLVWEGGHVAPIWLPAGIGIAALFLRGARLWPGLLLGFVLSALLRGAPPLVSAVLASVNTLEALLGAALLRGAGLQADLRRARDVLTLLFAAVVASAISATLGVGALSALAGPLGEAPRLWFTWMLANTMGVIALGAALLAWSGPLPLLTHMRGAAEGAAMLLLLGLASHVSFHDMGATGSWGPAGLALFPVMLWSALRLGPRGITAATLVASAMALWELSHTLAMQPLPAQRERLLFVQTFIGVFSIAGLVLAALEAQRTDAERALRWNEALLRAITEVAPFALLMLDEHTGRVLFFNERAIELLGLQDLEAGMRDGTVHAPQLSERFLQVVRAPESLRQQVAARLSTPMAPAETSDLGEVELQDGRILRRFSTQVRGQDGRYLGRLFSYEDITRRRRAQLDLERSHERYRALVSGLPDTLLRFTASGRLLDAFEPRSGALLSQPAERLIDRPLHESVPAPLAATLAKAGAVALSGAGAQVVEGRVATTTGDRDVEVRVVRSGPDEALATLRDVTEPRQMQARLLLSDRMASVGTLAAGVAHEINNPLSFVMANQTLLLENLEALQREAPSTRLRECIDLLRESAEGTERVRRIVRDLKVFTRHDEDAAGSVDLRHAIDRAVTLAWNEIRHKARLVKEYGEVPRLYANEARLGQVFLNLLVNAAQAIREGDVERNEIRIVTRAEGGYAIVEVHDTGAGIAKENLKRIFDPFFTTKPVGVGTGLGLAICHQIATAHGGDLSVESEPGRGSRFRLRLPLAPADERAPAPPPDVLPAAQRMPRVLVVDDEERLARSLSRLLAADHQVEVALSGREALERLQRDQRYDAILCDLMMPEVTGMDVHAELQRRWPELARRMIFLTGGAFTPAAREFLASTPNPRLDKPFGLEELRRLVRRIADRHEPETPGKSPPPAAPRPSDR